MDRPTEHIAYKILGLFSLLIVVWFRYYFTDEALAAVDLPAHIEVIDRYMQEWWRGHLTFYDPRWFSGWPALELYGFLSYLVGALLALPLKLISDEPARLSAHLLLVANAALLPWSMYYAAVPLGHELSDPRPTRMQGSSTLALFVGIFALWFLNHDRQWYGIGAAAIMHIGFYSQAFGWQLLLVYFGLLLRMAQGESHVRSLGIVLSLLLVTHTLSAVWATYLGALALLWYVQQRRQIFAAHLWGYGLSAFWFLPFLALAPDYTSLDIQRPKGDMLEVFLRYPLANLIQYLREELTKFPIFDPAYLLVLLLCLAVITHSRVRTSKIFLPFMLFLVGGVLIFSSDFVAFSLPIGLHYYRFKGYLFLFLVTMLAPVGLVFRAQGRVAFGAVCVLYAATACGVGIFPHPERDKVRASVDPAFLRDEQKVLEYFRTQKEKGRVWFEYASDYNRFPFLSCHYLSSRLYKETGFESLSALFVQSSLAYSFPGAAISMLGGRAYIASQLIPGKSSLDDHGKLQLLLAFGTTHVVTSTDQLMQRLKPFSAEDTVIGPYHVMRLIGPVAPAIAPVEKALVGYRDYTGTIPFKFLESYFSAKEDLYKNYELVELKPDQEIPPGINLLLTNGMDGTTRPASDGLQTIQLHYLPLPYIDHYDVHYHGTPDVDAFNLFADYLDRSLRMPELAKPHVTQVAAQLFWSKDFQDLQLAGFTPRRWQRINYSYFPYWGTRDGTLLRGTGERMLLLPTGAQATLQYSRWNSSWSWIGALLTLVSLLPFVSSRFLTRR